MFTLKPTYQPYIWGKLGCASEVACLLQANDSEFTIEDDQPYAELWMGDHHKARNEIQVNDVKIKLATFLMERHCPNLPFLLKVLSINKMSLSLQAHPNKDHAEFLHKLNPSIYKDDNHKPEMAIAITDFEGLCGIQPPSNILRNLLSIPELSALCGIKNVYSLRSAIEDNDKDAVKLTIKSNLLKLLNSDPAEAKSLILKLRERLNNSDFEEQNSDFLDKELFLRLSKRFPDDPACFAIYFINHIILKPGEALFVDANVPHAYLDGDCVEIMAASDNVVRGGLTKNFVDVQTFCDMVDYDGKDESGFVYRETPIDSYCSAYEQPSKDFSIHHIKIPAGKEYKLKSLHSDSIILVLEGKCQAYDGEKIVPLERGSILFLSGRHELCFKSISKHLSVFRAFCPYKSDV